MKELLSVKETSKILKIHPHHLYRLIHNKSIPFFKVKGIGIRFDSIELAEWIQEGKVETQDWEEFLNPLKGKKS